MQSASNFSFVVSIKNPVWLFSTTSFNPLILFAMTGIPHEDASITETPKLSLIEGQTKIEIF